MLHTTVSYTSVNFYLDWSEVVRRRLAVQQEVNSVAKTWGKLQSCFLPAGLSSWGSNFLPEASNKNTALQTVQTHRHTHTHTRANHPHSH